MVAIAEAFQQASGIPSFAEALTRALNPYEDVSLRVPFYITNTYRMKHGIKGLSMLMNPTNVTFKQSKRVTRRDTQGGACFFHWTNMVGRDNDILQMDFQGLTGNINLRTGGYNKTGGFFDRGAAYINKGTDWFNSKLSAAGDKVESGSVGLQPQGVAKNLAGASKLASFWNLYEITRAPVLDPTDGSPVYSMISYSSPLFGNTFVTFVGHFNDVLGFTDSAADPFNKQWNFGFTALGANPSLDYLYTAILRNLSTTFLNDLGA